MNYFTTILSSQAHTLRLPNQSKDDIERYVLQHQKGNGNPERAPFRRQLDFWAFAIASAIANRTPRLEGKLCQMGSEVRRHPICTDARRPVRNTRSNRTGHARPETTKV